MELPTKNKERRRGKADKAEGIGERGSKRGRKERRKEAREGRKNQSTFPMGPIPHDPFLLSNPGSSAQGGPHSRAKPTELSFRLTQGFGVLHFTVYTFWSSSNEKKKRKKIPRLSFGQFHLPLPLV